MAEYPIIMKQKNNQGDYDTLYPKTLGSQVQGMTLNQVSGNLDSSRIEGNIPSSQITGLPTSLPANGGNADTVGNQTVSQIIETAVSQGAKIVTGSYIGTGTYGSDSPNVLIFNFEPKFVLVQADGEFLGIRAVSWSKGLPYGGNLGYTHSTSEFLEVIFNLSGNSLSWYTESLDQQAQKQCNFSGTTYYYIAIG